MEKLLEHPPPPFIYEYEKLVTINRGDFKKEGQARVFCSLHSTVPAPGVPPGPSILPQLPAGTCLAAGPLARSSCFFSPDVFSNQKRRKTRWQQPLGAQHPARLLPIAQGTAGTRRPSPKWGEAPLSAGELTLGYFTLVPAFALIRVEITFLLQMPKLSLINHKSALKTTRLE